METRKVSNTSQRLQQIMAERGLRQVDIVNKCQPFCRQFHISINKANVSIWVKGTVEPNQDKLFVLGHALNVSEAWLMGYDVPMARNVERLIDFVVTSNDKDLLIAVESLDDEQKELLRKYIELLKITKR